MYTKEALQERRAKLPAEKQTLLQKRLRGEFTIETKPVTIPRRPENGPAPLSFAQERLWFLYELEPDSPTYNESAISRIKGKLNLEAFTRAYKEIVRRQEILRTTFQVIDDQPVQVVSPVPDDWDFLLLDLRRLPEAERLAQAEHLVQAERRRPFNLREEFPWRTLLIRLAEDDVVVCLTQHHISCDGWSITIFNSEFVALYKAFMTGQPISLPELPIQYADFAYWERQVLQEAALETKLNYWRQQLDGLTTLQMPTDHPRPPVITSNGATQYSHLSPALVKAVESLGQEGGFTDFMKFLAAFQVLLHRYTDQTDITIGSPVASRNRPELEGIIGFFLNTLVLRTDLSGDPTFLELLQRVRRTALGAFTHQDLPIDYLVTRIPFERDPSRNPLFQILFIWQDWQHMNPTQAIPELGVEMSEVEAFTGRAKFDITLSMEKREDGVTCCWEYNTDLFDGATISRMARQLETLLIGIVATPEERISRLPLLDKVEEQQLLVTWNETATPYPQDTCIHELFQAQVERTPGAGAVICEDQLFTYWELNQRANQLAHYLRRLGVGPEITVAICVERSIDMIVGLLGILKAGGAYVPLDPAYPAERLAFMLADSQAAILLTQQYLAQHLPFASDPSLNLLCLDSEWEQIAQESTENPGSSATAAKLAYLIYTSGSTGQPKGVMVPHRTLVNYSHAARDTFKLAPGERMLQFASLSFDTAAEEIYSSLISGTTLILRNDAMLSSVATFLGQCETWGITVLDLPTAYWHEITTALKSDSLTWPESVRLVIIGGERALPERFQTWQHFIGRKVQLLNTYGPTETTIVALAADLSALPESSQPPAELPIGRAVPNSQAYILDQHLQPVPVGVPGELYIGGAGVVRGYLYRPGLTAEKFIPDPFNHEPGARLYRTGDLARYRLNGCIEFLGRIDQQVKIRGFRVEPGEIEATLVQHTTVQEAVVLAQTDEHGDKRLIAYIVPMEGVMPDIAEWRHFLHEKLPAYMAPAAFVLLQQLPLTVSGKIDRRALATSHQVKFQRQVEFVPPRNEVEAQVTTIWEDILGVRPIGIYDDFFALGGHSLLAIRIISHVRRTFQADLSLRALFEKPTIAGLADEISLNSTKGLEAPPIQLVSRDKKLPLSFAQQRLWFLHHFQPESDSYTIPLAIRITGPLNVTALEQTFSEIVRRHESLRTAFVMGEEEPIQAIIPPVAFTLPVVDLQHLSKSEQEVEIWRRATQEAQQPFDLTCAPLLRGRLLQLGEVEHIFLLTTHHIVFDEWSMNVLGHEMAVLYPAFLKGQPVSLPELPIQYADYATWQREWLQGEILEAQLAYWRARLGDAPALLELPTDRPRPLLQTSAGATKRFMLPQALVESLKTLSQQEGVTLFMTFLAAFKVLLSRYSRQTDIVVGSPIANRNHLELEGLIGFFLNTLALRTNLDGNPTFRDLLARVREVTLGAYAHQDLPFEKLVEELQPERNLSTTPFFQVMFVLHNNEGARDFTLPELTLQPLDVDSRRARFDLTLYLEDIGHGLKGEVEYNTDLFDAETIEQIAEHFGRLLKGIAADPDRRIQALPLLGEGEWQEMVRQWNETTVPLAENASIHRLFEQQASRTPQAIALRHGRQALTYADLNRQANQVAHYLQRLGVGPESRVGLLLERTPALLVGLLGILKAGGAYVPLDPAYPPERLAYIRQDAGADVVVTSDDLRLTIDDLSPSTPIVNLKSKIVNLDSDWLLIGQEAESNPDAPLMPANLAYIIYTSGSTGQPKGVAISHDNAVALLTWAAEAFDNDEVAGVLAATSICFDLSVYELFLPLSQGGTVILARDALQLPELPAREQVTLINTVPSLMAELARSAELPPSARTINLAGEPLTRALVQQVYQQGSVAKVYNLYGPSEDTTYSTFVLVRQHDSHEPTIGCPIANTQTYILDEQMQPVPLGVVGELYLGGAGVSRCYLNRPALTAEKYVPDPFRDEPGGRLYRTGDLARYRRDGQIEFLGRGDHQVKIRGYRIELGEVEATLMQHPAVAAAVVMAWEDGQGGKQLVGYVVAAPGQTLVADELRHFLKTKLPDYMTPSHFVVLDSLPQTPNGKVDRRALPPPASDRSQVTVAYVAPRTATEEIMAAIWAEVLAVERVGVFDNFFDLGGHSLFAVRIISRLRRALQVELPLRTLFESPTVAQLAAAAEWAEYKAIMPRIQPASRDGDLPLSFAQQRLWFLEQLDPDSPSYNMPFAMILNGVLDPAVLEQSLNEVVRRHEILRTTFRAVDGQPIQVIRSEQLLSLLVIDLRHFSPTVRDAEAQRIAGQEAGRPFNLAEGPLLRAILLHLEDERYALLLNMHHIVCDEWSIDILGQEIITLYLAFTNDRPSPLPELPLQYADFALWQRHWLQGEVLEAQLDYWRQHLAGAPPLLELPTDRPRPAIQTDHGATKSFELPAALAEWLRLLSQQEGATLFMTLLAAFKVLLFRYSSQSHVVVGSPVANRNQLEVEGVIGFFVNTLVLHSDLGGNPTFRELLARVRNMAIGAYAHQDLPFEKLVEELQPERNLSHHPLFQVMFTLQNEKPVPPEIPGLRFAPLALENRTAKFDLTLTIEERANALTGTLEYNTDLFNAQTIERMITHFQRLLTGLTADPDRSIGDIPLLDEAEARQLLDWNETTVPAPLHHCLHQLFEEQATRTPGAIAVQSGKESLTYADLNRRANQLAHYLQRLGIVPESRVGLLMERTPAMIVGLLSILKAGGAYVPLDPAYPAERLAYILQDASVAVIMTSDELSSSIVNRQSSIVNLDTDWPTIAQEPDTDPQADITPANLAYLIYTSGSTGQPKGVMAPHRALVNYTAFARQQFGLGPGEKVLQFASLSFDTAAEEIYPALIGGATLVLRDDDMLSSVAQFLRYCHQWGITVLDLPTAYWHEVTASLETASLAIPEGIRLVIIGGERALPGHYHTWQAIVAEQVRLLNTYGPTETTIVATASDLTTYEPGGSELPIGRPIGNVRVYVLDEYGQPAPVGVPGELYIGGAGVTRGYLGRSRLTATYFVPDPFSAEPGARLYRTGDLVRYRPDGQLEFLGRRDQQVKIRGFRVELGEIESVLVGHPQVAEAALLALDDARGYKQLVAYVVGAGAEVPGTAELHAYLQEKLPSYMVPAIFVPLEAMPLTPNGKVDRRSLPQPNQARPDNMPYVAPRTPSEEMMVAIWTGVLRVEKVGVYDNFFSLGGHSLIGTQLMSRIRDTFQVELPLRLLFEDPTVAHLVEHIEIARWVSKESVSDNEPGDNYEEITL